MTSGSEQGAQAGALIGGRYVVEASLGQGGMGAVYLVRDERDGRKLALKQLHVDRAQNRALLFSQFEREYHTLTQLAHPRIIEVYDYGVDAGSAFYTMELLDGEDLREKGRQPWRDVCRILCDVSSSLAILHSRRLVHRDISARNVRCTREGRAKLIDFGAMATMGVAKHTVGTPPFVPPEALQLQALDGRADLYAMGSLAYWMLTGRYAYPARNFEQLRDLWRSAPHSPRQYDPTIPEPLDRLVMELISLDRAGRPDSAAEVMERLSGIAGLTLDELPEVSRAYLAMPTLVGRDAPLQEVRQLLVHSMQSKGGTLLIEAEEGVGRSRFLDAAVLEAKLLGGRVLRADRGDAGSDYGVVRALARQLLADSPQIASRAARPWRSLLARVVPELERASQPPLEVPQRRHLQSALRNWFLVAARKKHLVIAVDDVHDIDEPSAALLGTLAHSGQRHKLSLLLTTKQGAPASAALSLLRQIARPVQLLPLSGAQTFNLLRSVFGDVPHINGLAERVYQLAHGHPRWTMELCERLVERRVARYEAGSWALPEVLSSEDLPPSLGTLLTARIASLPPDARELGEVLSLTDAASIDVADYPALTTHHERARTHAAVDDLVAAGILLPDGARYRFIQRELAALLAGELDETHRRELHGRIAKVVIDSEDPLALPRHLLLGTREREGIEYLASLREHPKLFHSSDALALIEIAVARAPQLEIAPDVQSDLLGWLVSQTALQGDYERFHRHAWSLLDRLMQESGLADYQALADSGLPPETRMTQALEAARQRHDAAAPGQRGHTPEIACERLVTLCGTVVSMAGVSAELWPIERLPSILPLVPVQPNAALVHQYIEASRAMVSTRYEIAARHLAELTRQLENPGPSLPLHYVKQLRLGCRYMSALLTAGMGHPATRQLLKELESEPGHRVLAWRVYMIYELALGNLDAAADCQRRAELLNLQDGGQLIAPGTTVATELLVYSYAEDLIGVKRVVERMTGLAERLPGWRPFLDVARAQYYRLQGDPAAAMAALEPALKTIPGRTQAWTLAAPCHVLLLIALGDAAQAAERGLHYLQICEREGLSAARPAVQRVVAEALLKAGRVQEAQQVADDHIAGCLARGARGLLVGLAYETRTRVAIAMGDEAAVRRNAELCANEYKGGRNLTLSAKYQALMREAEIGGVTLTSGMQNALNVESSGTSQSIGDRTASSRLLACVDTQERAQEGMRMLLELTGARSGYLFAVRDGRIDSVQNEELPSAPQALRQLLNDYLRRTLESPEDVTGRDSKSSAAEELEAWTDAEGRRYEPMLLYGERGGERSVAAVAALYYDCDQRPVLRRDVLEMLAEMLSDDEHSAEIERTQIEAVPDA